ncbi:hypothetical protein EJJ20_20075 [Pseudomonas poae]|nr:hypothetical protein EJJ20_20075 [Pseudomonas poae]
MTDYTELQKAAEYAAQDTIKFADESEEMRALQQFHEEVDPETVLALIAENQRLTKQWGDRPAYRTPEYESRRDAMWRRAHMVATSKGYDHINMAIAAAPAVPARIAWVVVGNGRGRDSKRCMRNLQWQPRESVGGRA